jgi:carbonic anhydrase
MDRRSFIRGLAGLAFCPVCAKVGFAADEAHEQAHWSYEGVESPTHWGDLNAADRVCGIGRQQSPVAIDETISARLPRLRFAWAPQADTIVNNGHTIELNFADGGLLKVGSNAYKLVQFHFHHPSEHLVGDKASAMEIHFVHRHESGSLAVVGVFVTPGKRNAAFARVMGAAPQSSGDPVKTAAAINPLDLLPAARGYYRYEGSLTTPPCSEIVEWMVLKTPLTVAESDIAAFARLYPMNARPAQQLDRRFVLSSGG